jgi:hypothetical protein
MSRRTQSPNVSSKPVDRQTNSQTMKTDHNYLKKLTEDFISESIRDQDPAGLCFGTSFPLQIYLATKQLRSRLIKGEVPQPKANGTIQNVPHYWLQIDSGDIILDATIQQFKNPEPIYIGKLQDNEITEKYIPNNLALDSWFPDDFDSWKKPYEYSTFPLDCPFEKRSITYTIKLATILHAEIKNMDSPDDFIKEHFGLYFKPIYIFLCSWHSGIITFDIVKEKLPSSFDNLLSDALQWVNE